MVSAAKSLSQRLGEGVLNRPCSPHGLGLAAIEGHPPSRELTTNAN